MDFDGTLIDTAEPIIGKQTWLEKTGTEWPHKGWWGRRESLDMDVFGCEVIDMTFEAYKVLRLEPNTHMVMMTGRIPKLKEEVRLMLDHHLLQFDEYIYCYGATTLEFKLKKLNDYLIEYNDLRSIEIFEDRPEHTEAFRKFGETLIEEISFTVHQV